MDLGFLTTYRWPLLFYLAIILIIIALRRKFEWQGFAMGIYRSNVGLKLMQRLGTKYRGLFIVLGYIGIGVGFIGMGVIMWSLLQGAWKFLTDLSAPPVVTPVIPGFHIPGFELQVPLITGWIVLFALLVIHEFSHGVVSVAHKVPVKSSGLLVFGPLFGAFVEPDEKKVEKEHVTVNYAISAAGPWSNVLTAGLAVILSIILISPVVDWATEPDGVRISSVTDDYPAAIAGLEAGMIITGIGGESVTDSKQLATHLDAVGPDQEIMVDTNRGSYLVQTTTNPDTPESTKGYLGVKIEDHRGARAPGVFWAGLASVVLWIGEFFQWFILLSLGIGLANLLPIGPLDGGRMFRLASEQVAGNRKRGDKWWKRMTIFTIVLLVALLLFPLVRWIVT